MKGFIVDMPYYWRQNTWAETIKEGLLGFTLQDVSYVVELDYSDADIKLRAEGIRLDPATGEVVSKWEREQWKIKKKKKKSDDDEGEDENEDEEEEEELDADGNPIPKPKIFNEDEIV